MQLTEIEISGFRNLKQVCFSPASGLNLIHGDNGSGKTSLLEAIYYLAFAKSFRTNYLMRIIHATSSQFVLRANLTHLDDAVNIGIQRADTGKQRALIAGKPIKKLSELSQLMPIQFIDSSSHRDFSSLPGCRREFINWGLFHVEHSYLTSWQAFKRALTQRNAALKHCPDSDDFSQWNQIFIDTSLQVNKSRQDYIAKLQPCFYALWNSLSDFCDDLTLTYQPGWPDNQEFIDVLNNCRQKDVYLGHTHYGPQRSDLAFSFGNTSIFDRFSQGQLKLLLYLLHFSQSRLIEQSSNKKSIYLIDDLPAELDTDKRNKIVKTLVETGNQVFITGVLKQDLTALDLAQPAHEYHIEAGCLHLVNS